MKHGINKYLKYLRPLLVGSLLISGCATRGDKEISPLPVYLTDEEFRDGIVTPVFNLMVVVMGYYAERQEFPRSREQLAVVGTKIGQSIDWKRFSRLDFSDSDDELLVHADVVSRSSLSETGEIHTSWKLSVTRMQLAENKVRFSITPTPETHICVRGQRRPVDSMSELFIEFAIGLLAKTMPGQSEFCLRPATGRTDSKVNRAMNQRLEKMRGEILRDLEFNEVEQSK